VQALVWAAALSANKCADHRDRRPGPGAWCGARIGADAAQGRSGRGLRVLGRVATAGRRAAGVAQWGEGEFTQRGDSK
jgi:secreted trypsin-like serine protease